MKKLIPLTSTIIISAAVVAVSGEDTKKNAGKAKEEKVMEVDEVILSYLKANRPQLQIEAKGKTRMGGWKVRLSERVYAVPPADGIYAYDFVGTAPEMGTAAITPVSAKIIRDDIPKELKGVRVIAETNQKEAKLEPLPASAGK